MLRIIGISLEKNTEHSYLKISTFQYQASDAYTGHNVSIVYMFLKFNNNNKTCKYNKQITGLTLSCFVASSYSGGGFGMTKAGSAVVRLNVIVALAWSAFG